LNKSKRSAASELLLKGIGRVKCLEYDIPGKALSPSARVKILWERGERHRLMHISSGGVAQNENFKLDIAKLFMWRKQLCAASARDINSNLPAVCFRLFNKALPGRC
jgi:hypothetical protein